MTITVFRSKRSTSARDLARSLGGDLVRDKDDARYFAQRGLPVVCWGVGIGSVHPSARILNNAMWLNKLQQAQLMHARGVPTVEAVAADEFEFLARRFDHVGGRDLLSSRVDFYARRLNITEEYRLHVFKGRIIRAGKKVKRDHVNVHPWIRSYDGGWRISYGVWAPTDAMRKMCKDAVQALGLDFGAVDLALCRDESLRVLEVNRAPGIEGGTLERYKMAIERWRDQDGPARSQRDLS